MDLVDLRKLSAFVKVVETGSLTRASGQLAIAQSALSRKIRELEEELGVQLFHRNGRGVLLTEIGERFVERARLLLKDAEALHSEIRSLGCSPVGKVTLGVPPSISHLLLAPLLMTIRTEHPDIQIKVIEGFSGHIQEWLLDGRIDVGVLYGSRRLPTLLGDEILSEDMSAIGPAGDPLTSGESVPLARLCELPLVLPSRPHGLRLLVDDACAKAHLSPRIDFELDALSTIKSLASMAVAYTVLPASAVSEDLLEGRVSAARIVDPVISRKLLVATANQRSASTAIREVAHLIRAQVTGMVRENQWPRASFRRKAELIARLRA